MLNDPFVIDQSAKWALALVADGLTIEQRIERMFVRAFGRQPDADELGAAVDYLSELAGVHNVAAVDVAATAVIWQDFAQSLFCLKEFIYVR
jgi:hypothetical protein